MVVLLLFIQKYQQIQMSKFTISRTIKQQQCKSYRSSGNKCFSFRKIRHGFSSTNKKITKDVQLKPQIQIQILNPEIIVNQQVKHQMETSQRITIDKWKQKYYGSSGSKFTYTRSLNQLPLIKKNEKNQTNTNNKLDEFLSQKKRQCYRKLSQAFTTKKVAQSDSYYRNSAQRLTIGNLRFITVQKKKRYEHSDENVNIFAKLIEQNPKGWQFHHDIQQSEIIN